MFEYTAELISRTPSLTPWLIPLLPLVAAIVEWLRPERGRWLLAAMTATALVAALHLAWIVSLPMTRGALIAPLTTAIRIGSLDVTWTLLFDPLSGSVALAVALAAAALASSVRGTARVATALACAGAELAIVADGLPLVLIGWALLALAGFLHSATPAGAGIPRLAELSVLAGFGIVTWGLGGEFSEGGYAPDFRPRLVSVEAPKTSEAADSARHGAAYGKLTMSALPGARVRLGDAELCAEDARGRSGGVGTPSEPCRRVARSPFAGLELPAAMHSLRVLPGPGTYELRIDTVRVRPGATTHLALTGSTLVFHEVAEQLELRDKDGAHAVRRALLQRKTWGVPLLELALTLIVLGLAARAGLFPFGGARPGAAYVLEQAAVGYLALRLAPLLSLAPVASSLLALVALPTLLVVAEALLRAPSGADVSRAAGALALLAAAIGAFASGTAVLVVLLPAAAVFAAAHERPEPLAARMAALAIAAAPLPLLGAFGARDSFLWSAFRQQSAAYLPGWLIAIVALACWTALAYGAWRLAYAAAPLARRGKKKRPAAQNRWLVAVAATALALGLPAWSPSALTAGGATTFETWLSTSFLPAEPSFEVAPLGIRWLWLTASFGLAVAAWSFARRRRELFPAWPALAGAPRIEARLVALAAGALDALSHAVARADRVFERGDRERT